jgi:transcriptional regulator with XRE-family HTH domain
MSQLTRHLEKVRATRAKDLPAIAAASGVAIQTLREIKYGRAGKPLNPRLETLEKLANYYRKRTV